MKAIKFIGTYLPWFGIGFFIPSLIECASISSIKRYAWIFIGVIVISEICKLIYEYKPIKL